MFKVKTIYAYEILEIKQMKEQDKKYQPRYYGNNISPHLDIEHNINRIWEYIKNTLDENQEKHELNIGDLQLQFDALTGSLDSLRNQHYNLRDTSKTEFEGIAFNISNILSRLKVLEENKLKAVNAKINNVEYTLNERFMYKTNKTQQQVNDHEQQIQNIQSELNKLIQEIHKKLNEGLYGDGRPITEDIKQAHANIVAIYKGETWIIDKTKEAKTKSWIDLTGIRIQLDESLPDDVIVMKNVPNGVTISHYTANLGEYMSNYYILGYKVPKKAYDHYLEVSQSVKKLEGKLWAVNETNGHQKERIEILEQKLSDTNKQLTASKSRVDSLEKYIKHEEISHNNEREEFNKLIKSKDESISKMEAEIEKLSLVPANKYWTLKTENESLKKANESLKDSHGRMKQQYDKKYEDMVKNYNNQIKKDLVEYRDRAWKAEEQVRILKESISIVKGVENNND